MQDGNDCELHHHHHHHTQRATLLETLTIPPREGGRFRKSKTEKGRGGKRDWGIVGGEKGRESEREPKGMGERTRMKVNIPKGKRG